MTDQVTTWLNGLVYKEKIGLAYKIKQNDGLMVLYIRKKTKMADQVTWHFSNGYIFLFNVETSGLKRWTP